MEEKNKARQSGQIIPGKAAVVSGKLVVTDPTGGGRLAMVKPGEGVILQVNGRVITGSTTVRSTDRVKIEALIEEQPPRLKIRKSADGMLAEGFLAPGKRITYRIPDQAPVEELTIRAESEEEPLAVLSSEAFKEALSRERIVFGLLEEALQKLNDNPETWVELARGLPVKPGQNGYVECLFQRDLTRVVYDESKTEVDLRERYSIPQVNEGELIARIHPPVPGSPGKRVSGEDVNPPPVQPAEVQCDNGTVLVESGKAIASQRKGRPVCIVRGGVHVFRIDDLYIHDKPVDMESGNLYFKGNLMVKGFVHEGMKVSADQGIAISGGAAGAVITAGGDVILEKNCIQCTIRAGALDLLVAEVSKVVGEIAEKLTVIKDAAQQMLETLEKRGHNIRDRFPVLLSTIMYNKFPEIPGQVTELEQQLNKQQFSPPAVIKKTVDECAIFFVHRTHRAINNWEQFEKFYEWLQNTVSYMSTLGAKANIKAHYVQNCNLVCTGDIYIAGPGSYHSNFQCGGDVYVKRLFRGGNIEAGGNVYIWEAGSPAAARTEGVIAVPSTGAIYMAKVHENTKVRVGNLVYNFDHEATNLKIYMDRERHELARAYWVPRIQ